MSYPPDPARQAEAQEYFWHTILDAATTPADLTRPLYGASFGAAIKRFFKNYARFSGRASRSEYWWVVLFVCMLAVVPYFVTVISVIPFLWAEPESQEARVAGFLFFTGSALLSIGALALIVPALALGWRRLHDANLPGVLSALILMPWFAMTVFGWLSQISSDDTLSVTRPLFIILIFTWIVPVVLAFLPPKPEGRRFDRPRRG